jgi:molecular chaperone GrpE
VPAPAPAPGQAASSTPEPAPAQAAQSTKAAQYAEIASVGEADAAAATAAPTIDILTEPLVDVLEVPPDLSAALAAAEAKATEHYDAWLRAKAEGENIRRRAQDDITKASKFAAEKFASAMLPVKDSLEAALAIDNQTVEKLREGVELTLKQLTTAFGSASLTEENPLGQKFDPNKHQAISALEADAEPNTVINVLQKGYLLHGRVIRPAMVIVAKAKA